MVVVVVVVVDGAGTGCGVEVPSPSLIAAIVALSPPALEPEFVVAAPLPLAFSDPPHPDAPMSAELSNPKTPNNIARRCPTVMSISCSL